MQALPTQFDDSQFSSTVATPTCCSCCCCCCCLTTALTSSSLLVQRIGKETREHQVQHPIFLKLLVGLLPFVFIGGSIGSYFFQDELTEIVVNTTGIYLGPINGVIIIGVLLPAVILVLVLRAVYSTVHMNKSLLRATLVGLGIALTTLLEAYTGMFLILLTQGTRVYLLAAIVLTLVISLRYHNKLKKKEVNNPGAAKEGSIDSTPSSSGNVVYPGNQQPEDTNDHQNVSTEDS